MRHATEAALDELDPLLERIRGVPGLVEKKRGVFYCQSKAFLHFHEDPSGFHADVRVGDEFERLRVQSRREQSALLQHIRSALA